MALFSIETLYFISLGVIFGLILLLIFHFRNKILQLEKQVQSLHGVASELIQDMKESQKASQLYPFTQYPIPSMYTNDILVKKCDESDEEDEEESEEDEDSDDESESEEEPDTLGINLGETISSDEVGLIEEPLMVTESLERKIEKEVAEEVEKYGLETVEKTQEEMEEDISEMVLDVVEPKEAVLEVEQVIQAEVEQVIQEEIETKEVVLEEDEDDDEENKTTVTEKTQEVGTKLDYKKWSVQKLRDLLVEKGLATVHTKQKKDELLKIIKENNL